MPLTTITWRARAVSAPSARRASPPSISTAKPRPGPPDSMAARSRNRVVARRLLAEQRDGRQRRRVEHQIARVVGRDAVGVGDGDARHAARRQPRRQPHRRGPAGLDGDRGVGDRSIVDGEHDLRPARRGCRGWSPRRPARRPRAGPARRRGSRPGPPTSTTSSVRPSAIAPAGCSTSRSLTRTSRPVAAPARRVAALHSGVSAVPPLPAASVATAARAAPRSRLGSASTVARSSTRISARRSPGRRGADGPQRRVLGLLHPARRAHAERRIDGDDGHAADGVLAADVGPGEGRGQQRQRGDAQRQQQQVAQLARPPRFDRRPAQEAHRGERVRRRGVLPAQVQHDRHATASAPSRNHGERKDSPIIASYRRARARR